MLNFLTISILILIIAYAYFDIKNLYTTRFFFIIFWFLYTFTVPLDLLLNLRIKSFEYLIDLNDEKYLSLITDVVVMGISALTGFLIGYFIVYSIKKRQNSTSTDTYICINKNFILLLNLIFISLYILFFLNFSRQEISLAINSNSVFKFYFILLFFIKGINIIYIVKNRNISLFIIIVILIMPILQGNRIDLIIYLVAILFRKKIKLSFFQFFYLFLLFFIFMYFWKILYSVIFYGLDYTIDLSNNLYGLSSIEFLPSFAIAVEYLKSYEYGYLGQTYLNFIYEIVPKNLFNVFYTSLTNDFSSNFVPTMYKNGASLAFSFYAESWYNFGFLGSFLICFWVGLISATVDIKNNVLVKVIFVFFIIRFWRTEFSLLFKQVYLLSLSIMACYIYYWFKIKFMYFRNL